MVEPSPSLVLNYFLHDVPPLFPNKTRWFPKKFPNPFILLQNLTNPSKLNFKQTITPISTFLLKRLWKIQAASRTLGLKTLPTFKNNPRTLPYAPYNDNALHYVDQKQKPLCMAFPAVIDLNGKFTKIGPYFNLMGDQTVKVSFHSYHHRRHIEHLIYHQDVNMTLLAKTKAIF